MELQLDLSVILSGASFLFTSYFWLVKARQERPHLEFFQIADFRVTTRRHPVRQDKKRLCVQQLGTGGVLIVNHSIRQNSVVMFQCSLLTDAGEIAGDWGYSDDDPPPWNIGAESTIAFSPACFFDVPDDFEAPANPTFRMEFITAGGGHFSHTFTKRTPRLHGATNRSQRAA